MRGYGLWMRPILSALLVLVACQGDSAPVDTSAEVGLPADVVASLDPTRMKSMVDRLADDALTGRLSGSVGHDLAFEDVLGWMQDAGLEPAGLDGDYVYPYAAEPVDGFYMLDESGAVVPHDTDYGLNLMGLVPGSDPERAHETIVVMAHWDHLGVTEEGGIYNGAFDDAGGVAVAMEVARLFATHGAPARSLLFMFTDGEEGGLDSPRAWLDEPTIDPTDVVCAISVDPIGRPLLPDYAPVVFSGIERSPALQDRFEALAPLVDAPVVFVNRDLIPVFSSDQDPFFEHSDPRPGVWMVTPGMSFYHTTGDVAETIDYNVMLDSAELLAQVLWDVGNDTAAYPYEGPQPLDAQAGTDVRALLEGVAESSEITGSERNQVEDYLDVLDEGIAADDLTSIPGWQGYNVAMVYFLLFELSEAHPGPIPPPFPE